MPAMGSHDDQIGFPIICFSQNEDLRLAARDLGKLQLLHAKLIQQNARVTKRRFGSRFALSVEAR